MTRRSVDISPFALPGRSPGEIRFESPRDIATVDVAFAGDVPARICLSYLQRVWPKVRYETMMAMDNPFAFGWTPMDDWFNCEWRRAAIRVKKGKDKAIIVFQGLTKEFRECTDYDVNFRRTIGLRIEVSKKISIKKIAVYTNSARAQTTLRVGLDSGKRTDGKSVRISGYNAVVGKISTVKGITVKDGSLQLGKSTRRSFEITVRHMEPSHRYCHDDGHITFSLDREMFTISIPDLFREGPIWFAEQGVYVCRADDSTTFTQYMERIRSGQTVAQKVMSRSEQSYGGAFHGQPRPHAVGYSFGCKHARQRFWLESNGDIVLLKRNVLKEGITGWVEGKDSVRFKNSGSGRFFFGLERWCVSGRFPDPAPVLACNIHMKHDNMLLEQKSFAVPLFRSIRGRELSGDDTIVALVRFRFRNEGDVPLTAELPIQYSENSNRACDSLGMYDECIHDEYMVPRSKKEVLHAEDGRITSVQNRETVLRCIYDSTMKSIQQGDGLLLVQELQPGETCEIVLRIPYIAVDLDEEVMALNRLNFEGCYREVTTFWREEGRAGAQLYTPEPRLNALYKAHLSHVLLTSCAMPDNKNLVNTWVGSIYGNFSNESCMIIRELDERSLHDEARRRLDVWVKYQGTASLSGNFTDYDGVYYGAGGFEQGDSYNQHHGWVLWCLCGHYFLTGDRVWFEGIAGSIIAGADWIFRQRRKTMKDIPFSRGWEYGFLPAGSLEDVRDFRYWLSTNTMTWRGADSAARALAAIGHPQAERIRREADAYRKDLIRGFEIMRQQAPLVRLSNGRWVPHYPSSIYCRGRSLGWLREVLEGAIYLLISGLYNPKSKQAEWILDDYQDNLYVKPPFGYQIENPEVNWYDRSGFSMQPNLLAGLMPYLHRDEPEIYIWMFFNAWCSCYREEINAMVEHPAPVLGYSNAAGFKTSDEANAVMWLRYMFVYTEEQLLHLGRAIPRQWLADGQEIRAEGISTCFGDIGIRFQSMARRGKIVAIARLSFREIPGKILIRIRHPQKEPIKSVIVNGKQWRSFDKKKGDIDITGQDGKVIIEASY